MLKLPELRKQVKAREERLRMEENKTVAQRVRAALEGIQQQQQVPPAAAPQVAPAVAAAATTQLVKVQTPLAWVGQKFDKWKQEVLKWKETNRAGDEEKYYDLVEGLKKNESIKGYVTKTLVEKVGETRTVDRVLEILEQKYSKTE